REAMTQYDRREAELGEELMRWLERAVLLHIIDQRWQEHLYDMDYLREGIHLRGFAQIEPLVAYKNEAFELFRDLMNSVWGDFARMIFHVEVTVEGENGGGPPQQTRRSAPGSSSSTGGRNVSYSGGGMSQPSALAMAAASAGASEGFAGGDGEPPLPPVGRRRVKLPRVIVRVQRLALASWAVGGTHRLWRTRPGKRCWTANSTDAGSDSRNAIVVPLGGVCLCLVRDVTARATANVELV